MNAYMRNYYRNCCEDGGETGTLEHRPATPADSCGSGVPVSSGHTGTRGWGLEHRSGSALFVSSDLQSWSTDQPNIFARDVQINDTAYRRLDPEYYAWLRSKMNLVKMAAGAGHLGRAEFDELRGRFNAMHEWAVTDFGERALIEAIRNLDARDYAPPVPEPETPHRAPRPAEIAMGNALATVDAVAETATALGWTRESLYQTSKSPLGFNCGLAHFLKPSDRIGEVTTHWIEIVHPGDVRHRFYNPNVDQPWIRRIKSGAE